MEAHRFDSLVMTMRNRRSLLGLVAGVAVSFGAISDDAAAKTCKNQCGL